MKNALLIEQTSMKQAIFNEMKEKMENIKHMIALENNTYKFLIMVFHCFY